MHVSDLPPKVHVADMLLNEMKKTKAGRDKLPSICKIYSASRRAPSSLAGQEEWKNFFWHNVLRTGIHQHSFTCRQPPSGRWRCRGAYPQETCGTTGPHMLRIDEKQLQEAKEGLRPLTEVLPSLSSEPIHPLPHPSKRDIFCQPVVKPDDRLIVWEIKRSKMRSLPALQQCHRKAFEAASMGPNSDRGNKGEGFFFMCFMSEPSFFGWAMALSTCLFGFSNGC